MKNRSTSSLSPSKTGQSGKAKSPFVVFGSPNESLDPKLLKLVHSLGAKDRLRLANLYARRADQLILSVRKMAPSLVDDFKPPVAMPKAFFLVNLPKWQKDELARDAKASGWSLRDAMTWGMRDVMQKMRDNARLARLTGIKSPEARTEKLFLPNRENN